MEARKRKTLILTLLLILIAAILIIVYSAVQAMRSSPPAVDTVAGERRDFSERLLVSGAVTADAIFETTLGAGQKVVAVHKKVGDPVQAGDLLVELDTADLQYQLDKAMVGLDQIKASTASARAQAQISLSTAQVALAQARKNHDDVLKKYSNRRVTALVRDQSATALRTAENQVKLAQAIYDSLDLASPASERKKQIDAASLDIENLRRKIADSAIRSAIPGTVTALDARLDQFPNVQTGFVQVVDLRMLTIRARVDQYEAVHLKPGQEASVRVKGLSGEFDARISRVDDMAIAQGTATSAKYHVRIMIDPVMLAEAQAIRLSAGVSAENPSDGKAQGNSGSSRTSGMEAAALVAALKPGYEVDVQVTLLERGNALAVPATAIVPDNGQDTVFVVRSGAAFRLPIETGLENEGWTEVLAGITSEDVVIVLPPKSLKAGDAVTVR